MWLSTWSPRIACGPCLFAVCHQTSGDSWSHQSRSFWQQRVLLTEFCSELSSTIRCPQH